MLFWYIIKMSLLDFEFDILCWIKAKWDFNNRFSVGNEERSGRESGKENATHFKGSGKGDHKKRLLLQTIQEREIVQTY